MPAPKHWARGEFCWYELGTSDPEGARRFYSALFGWTTLDVPMGPAGVYTLLRHRDTDIAGMYKLEGPQFQGVPPHWMTYVASDNVDADSERATSLGAKVCVGPMDIPNVGRMSVIQDPQGAMISLFQAGEHPGSGNFDGAAGTFCWSELATNDTAAARQFYTSLLGWKAKVGTAAPMEYTEWIVGDRPRGGMMAMDAKWGAIPPHWLNYIAVADCDAVAGQARKLDAKIVVPPSDIPNVGRFSILADPQGAHFALYQRR
ncbi:MAG TPA: VOC family protein [Candidatus Polarisedimenticolaceae bacterium]|nr:VOC family protein [Candidatus Polarisedimenticolaceae bacterium]